MATLKNLRDDDGRGFARYHADINKIYRNMEAIQKAPSVEQMRVVVTDGVRNPNLLAVKLLSLKMPQRNLQVQRLGLHFLTAASNLSTLRLPWTSKLLLSSQRLLELARLRNVLNVGRLATARAIAYLSDVQGVEMN